MIFGKKPKPVLKEPTKNPPSEWCDGTQNCHMQSIHKHGRPCTSSCNDCCGFRTVDMTWWPVIARGYMWIYKQGE